MDCPNCGYKWPNRTKEPKRCPACQHKLHPSPITNKTKRQEIGDFGENLAIEYFLNEGYHIEEFNCLVKAHSPSDFVVTKNNQRYRVNVKHGEGCAISSRNLQRMFQNAKPKEIVSILYIDVNRNHYFMPISFSQ